MRRFNAWALCLNGAREPSACNQGHLFCKECVYTDLCELPDQGGRSWAQKKDIKEEKKKDAEDERTRAKEAARERVLEEFEIQVVPSQAATPMNLSLTTFSLRICLHDLGKARGTKRKFAFDSSMIETLAKEAEESALIQIEKDQAATLKHKFPDFWLPSLTPTYTSNGPPQSLLDVKLQTTCRGGNPPHPLSSVLQARLLIQYTIVLLVLPLQMASEAVRGARTCQKFISKPESIGKIEATWKDGTCQWIPIA